MAQFLSYAGYRKKHLFWWGNRSRPKFKKVRHNDGDNCTSYLVTNFEPPSSVTLAKTTFPVETQGPVIPLYSHRRSLVGDSGSGVLLFRVAKEHKWLGNMRFRMFPLLPTSRQPNFLYIYAFKLLVFIYL